MRRSSPMLRTSLAIGVVVAVAIVALPSNATAAPLSLSATAASGHITIKRANPDGTISVRLYNFVPGSNAARNFITPAGWIRTDKASSSKAAVSASVVCQWANVQFQGAQGLGDNPLIYPCLRWGWGGHSDPQVYFRDHTPAAWPVWQSVADWNTTVGIDSYYIWETSPCPSTTTGKHCVNVWAGPYGTGQLRAWTDYRYDDRSNRLIDGTVAIYFNTSYNHGDANEHRATVCEELGHALGVGHNTRDVEASCMNMSTGVSPLNDRFPGINDKGLLTNVVYPD